MLNYDLDQVITTNRGSKENTSKRGETAGDQDSHTVIMSIHSLEEGRETAKQAETGAKAMSELLDSLEGKQKEAEEASPTMKFKRIAANENK